MLAYSVYGQCMHVVVHARMCEVPFGVVEEVAGASFL